MSKLLNISEASSIAIHSMVLIAGADKILNVTQIADCLGFSKNHLAKILQTLVRHNYLESTRGPNGGFWMKAKPEEISILEIYELIEGKVDDNPCIHNSKDCVFSECVYSDFSSRLNQQFKEFFSDRKLSHIVVKSKNIKDDKRDN